jgi:hypothetical protein
MQPIFWVGRRDKGIYKSNLKNGPSYDVPRFHGPTPWKKREPLCTEAVSPVASFDSAGRLAVLVGDDEYTQTKREGRTGRFGQWMLDENTFVPHFDDEDRFQREEVLPDPRGLDPGQWVSSDLLDNVVKDCQEKKHPEVIVFKASIAALLHNSDINPETLTPRFWVFPQSNASRSQEATHWWITIVDRVKGHIYSHDSSQGACDPRVFFSTLQGLFATPAVQAMPGTAPALRCPRRTWVVPTRQQGNGYDCGVFTAKTLMSFVEAITEIGLNVPVDDTSPAGVPRVPPAGEWSPSEYRKYLKEKYPASPLLSRINMYLRS